MIILPGIKVDKYSSFDSSKCFLFNCRNEEAQIFSIEMTHDSSMRLTDSMLMSEEHELKQKR